MWAPGARIGKYKLVERLGKGGMAETWRAELVGAEGVRRGVVLKRVLPSFADNREFVAAFIQEASLTASLSHGNVAQVFDFGQLDDGSHFIAMELIDGASLDRVLKRGIARGYWHMPFPIAALIALEAAKGLEHVHTRRGPKGPLNIVHRDISPDNIIVGLNGETKVIDFGVAKSMSSKGQQTESGVIKGKSIYFSPEQANEEQVDFRTDIYALGVVLYRLCTGKKAFDGTGFKVLQAVVNGAYEPARQVNPDLPEELALVIETAMATDKRERFATTLELVEALQSTLRTLAPKAGVHWIRGWMRWLYADDLKKRGEAPDLRPGFEELIINWKPRAPPRDLTELAVSGESPHGMATIGSRPGSRPHTAHPSAAVDAPLLPSIEWTPKLKRQVAAGLTGGLLAIAGFVALTTARDAHDGDSDAERDRHVAEAKRLKPIQQRQPPEPPRTPVRTAPPDQPETPPVVAPPPVVPPPDPNLVSYDSERAPAKFTLGKPHQVPLDAVSPLPGSSGLATGLTLLTRQRTSTRYRLYNTHTTFDVPDNMDPDAPGPGKVPPMLFVPGKKSTLELALRQARWSRPEARVVVFVGSAGESPQDPLYLTANGKPFAPAGIPVVVDPNDRFSLGDLTGRAAWKVVVTARVTNPAQSVSPALLVANGEKVRLDGRELIEGYGVLYPGTHQLSGAASAWLTVPALGSMDVAPLDVSFEP